MASGRSRRRSLERRPRRGTGRRSVAAPPKTGIGPTVRAVSAGSDHRSPVAIYGQLLYSRRQSHWPESTSNRRPSTPRTVPAYRSGPSSTTFTTPHIRTVLRRPIEHRLFSQITRNWQGRPLTSHETILSLIGATTTTTTGLSVTAELDDGAY